MMLARSAIRHIDEGDSAESRDECVELVDICSQLLAHYEATCDRLEKPVPYSRIENVTPRNT